MDKIKKNAKDQNRKVLLNNPNKTCVHLLGVTKNSLLQTE